MKFGLGYLRFAILSSCFWSRAILTKLNRPPFLIGWLGPWRGFALGHSHGPFDRLQPHLLNIRPVPHLLLVTQRGIEYAPFAEIAHPRYREIFIRAMDILFREVNRVRVHAHEHAHPVARVVLELVDLVGDLERRRKVFGGGKVAVLHLDGDLLVPRMIVEIAADHFAILRPLVESVGGG